MPHDNDLLALFPVVYTDEGQPVVALADVAKVLGLTEEQALQELEAIGQAHAVLERPHDQIYRQH